MESKPLNIVEVLQDPKRFVVPVYQRTYEWQIDNQINKFFALVEGKANERLSGSTRTLPHYMGAILLMPRGPQSFGKLPVYDVVDGQQRLTTFQIALAAMRDLARSLGLEGVAEQIAPYILNTATALMQDEREERYKLHTTKFDRSLFRDLVDLDRGQLREKYAAYFYQKGTIKKAEAPKPLNAYWYFRDEAEEYVTDGTAEEAARRLGALAAALLEDIRVIVITLGVEDDAQVIFESLNSGGEPLAAMDLVRNDVFHRAVRQGENVEHLMEQRWATFEDPFWKREDTQGRLRKPRIDFFLAHTLAAETGAEILLSELYARYKSFVKDRNFANVDAELQVLLRHAPTYRQLVEPNGATALARLARRLEAFDVSTAFPLVFVVTASKAPQTEKDAIYELVASYVIRRSLCEGLTAKNYNQVFLKLAFALDQIEVSADAFASYFRGAVGDSVRFPKDQELTNAILNTRQYTRLTQPRIKWILTELELASRDKFDEAHGIREDLSIEHILPDEWSTHWPLSDGTRAPPDKRTGLNGDQLVESENRERMKHTLGNLTLLTQPANLEVLNYDFAEKAKRLRKSMLHLNLETAEEPTWDVEAIRRRAQRLAALAVRIWPAPAP